MSEQETHPPLALGKKQYGIIAQAIERWREGGTTGFLPNWFGFLVWCRWAPGWELRQVMYRATGCTSWG